MVGCVCAVLNCVNRYSTGVETQVPGWLIQAIFGPVALQYLVSSDRRTLNRGQPPPFMHRPSRAFLSTSLRSATHAPQQNGQGRSPSRFTPSAVTVLLDHFPTFFLHRLQHRMKRRRRLEQMEQALQAANRKTDHHFIQDFLLMLDNLQTRPIHDIQCLMS